MKKLTTKRQMLLYAISGMGVNMLNLMMGSYLCSAILLGQSFKTELAIQNQTFVQKDLVIAGAWAVFALIAKVLDGIIDIPMASLTDNLKSRWGRRRPAILLGLLPMIASYILFLLVPDPSGATWLNTIYYGVLLSIFYIFYTLTMVTYYATFTEIVDTPEERNFISNVKSVCDIVYFILGYVVVSALLKGMRLQLVALIVLPLVLTMLIPLFMIRESSTKDSTADKNKSVRLFASLKHTLRNKTFVVWMVVYAFMTFGVQLFLGGINEYFDHAGLSMIIIMACAFGPVPLTLILYNKLIVKKGFGFAYRYTLLIFATGMLWLFAISFLPAGLAKTLLSVVGGLICSFSVGALFAVAYSIPAELAAQEEKKTGIANSAMYFAVQGLFAGIASGIATGLVLTALKGTQDVPSDGITYMTLICAVGVLAAFALSFILPKSLMGLGKHAEK